MFDLGKNWPVYVLLGFMIWFFSYVIRHGKRQEKPGKEKEKHGSDK